MSFRTAPGITYRFYTGKPLFAYGSGLSLTSFDLVAVQEPLQSERKSSQYAVHHLITVATVELRPAVTLSNVGTLPGSSIAFAWFGPLDVHHQDYLAKRLGQAPPQHLLASYTRSRSLNVGEVQRLEFRVDINDLGFVDVSGTRVLPAGDYLLQLDLGPKG